MEMAVLAASYGINQGKHTTGTTRDQVVEGSCGVHGGGAGKRSHGAENEQAEKLHVGVFDGKKIIEFHKRIPAGDV